MNETIVGQLTNISAEVIKIEHPTKGDDTRHWGPPYAKYTEQSGKEGVGESAYFLAVQRPVLSLLQPTPDLSIH
jgi:succinate--hydroxymethylglutarate CoA-transferase